jgi:hypothetical protein
MRYMMLVKVTESNAGPTEELMRALGGLAQKRMASGHLLESGGLAGSSKGARMRLSKGAVAVFDGPFPETTEVLGGYAIMKADSRDEALSLGREFLQVHADVLGPSCEMELEVREMCEPMAEV